MTKHTGFRRACSLRVPKAPGLLDCVPGSSYGSLEEAPLPWEAEEAPWRVDPSLGHSQEGASQEAARKKGSCRRRALSLKGQDMKDEEASPAGEASDGQLLIGQAHDKAQASNRVKRCQKVRGEGPAVWGEGRLLSKGACPPQRFFKQHKAEFPREPHHAC